MKKNLILFALIIGLHFSYAQITKDAAFEIVKETILENDYLTKNIYVQNTLVSPQDTLRTLNSVIIAPNYYSWFFFIDDNPLANWGHECRYVFINSNDGTIYIQNATFPPSSFGNLNTLYEKPIPESTLERITVPQKTQKSICTSDNDYAVIIKWGRKYV